MIGRGRALGPGRLFKRGKAWVLDFREAGGQRRHWTLGPDKRVAEARRLELINQRNMELEGLGSSEGRRRGLVEIAELYLADLRARVSPMHLRNLEIRLAHTLAALGERRVGDLKPHDLVRLRSEATQAGKSNRTANLIVETMRAMLNWAVETGLISESPLKRIKKLPEGKDHQRYKRRALGAEELGRFLAASAEDDRTAALMAESKGHARVPQTPLWILCLETGGRWNELRLLTWADVDLVASILTLRAENTKSRKARAIPLTPRAHAALQGLRAEHRHVLGRLPTAHDRVLLSPDGVPWPKPTTNPMRILDRVLDRAGIAKWDPRGEKLDIHALRHTFATRMARAGVPLSHAQAALGHSDPKLTAQVYTHLQAEDLRGSMAAMGELPGGAPPASGPTNRAQVAG